jgi:hypothetical protein
MTREGQSHTHCSAQIQKLAEITSVRRFTLSASRPNNFTSLPGTEAVDFIGNKNAICLILFGSYQTSFFVEIDRLPKLR